MRIIKDIVINSPEKQKLLTRVLLVKIGIQWVLLGGLLTAAWSGDWKAGFGGAAIGIVLLVWNAFQKAKLHE